MQTGFDSPEQLHNSIHIAKGRGRKFQLRGESCKKGTETGEEGACMPRFCQFGEQVFVFRVVFIGPQVFKAKAANDSDKLGYGFLVTAGQWSMCLSLCPHESVAPKNACSWRSLDKFRKNQERI
jgi:hypothetical protein